MLDLVSYLLVPPALFVFLIFLTGKYPMGAAREGGHGAHPGGAGCSSTTGRACSWRCSLAARRRCPRDQGPLLSGAVAPPAGAARADANERLPGAQEGRGGAGGRGVNEGRFQIQEREFIVVCVSFRSQLSSYDMSS